MTRALPAGLLLAAALFAAWPAGAQLSVTFLEREESASDRDGYEDGFNIEECENDMPMTFRLSYTGSLGAGDLYVYLGSSCNEKENRDEDRCYAAVENRPLETLSNFSIYPNWVVDPMGDPPTCAEGEGATDVWFLVLADDSDQSVVYQSQATINYDTMPPQPPVDIEAGYGEGMISVRWDVAEPDFPDEWEHFWVMCWGEGMSVPEPSPEPAPDASTDPATDPAADPVDDPPDDVPDDADDVDDDAAASDPAPDPASDPPVSDGSASDGSSAEGCPAGGFSAGDAFDEGYACSDRLGQSSRSFDLRGLTNNQPYMVSVVAEDAFGNKSVIGAIVCETPMEVDDFWEVYKKQGGGDDGGFCFVATAAYGHYDHPAVRSLRAFRDEVLEAMPGGGLAVRAYYRASPPAARWLREHPTARTGARAALWPAAGAARAAVEAVRHPLATLALFMALAACALALVRRGARR
ncbi:MAG: hypothetical protein JRG91_11035 [Deltaproteobacteria bacterium]|nr:hypothetical protein [Deltaproteobacteria bacterium]